MPVLCADCKHARELKAAAFEHGNQLLAQPDPSIAENITFNVIPADGITAEEWTACADTFSQHYGVWSPAAPANLGPWAVPGNLPLSSYLPHKNY